MGTKLTWKKGHGKLGVLAPLLGSWQADADTPDGRPGKIRCERRFKKELQGSYVELNAIWYMGEGNETYEEHCFFGCDASGTLRFWSFTSDGKQSSGELTDVTDVHPEAIGFVVQMPAGIARQIYWPDETEGFHWAVESQTEKGWDRFVDHYYVAEEPVIQR